VGEREENLIMNDQTLEPLEIDGRAPIGRIGGLADDSRFDLAALLWMLCTLTFVGCGIYTVLKVAPNGSEDSFWPKISGLSATGGPVVAISCLVGIGLAVMFHTAAARFALLLATLGGVWVFVAGVFGIAATLHEPNYASGFTYGNRAVGVLAALSFTGIGLVVAAIGLRAMSSPAVSQVS
jgi:hypothetical protein